MVTSATYRQASKFTPELLERDPENRLLARGPRYRLPAEVLRDQALALGGLLVEHLGGPSVKPYQPAGLWEAVRYNGEQTYEQDHGSAALPPQPVHVLEAAGSAAGHADRSTARRARLCTVRRPRTNTPLQALVLLNDVTYVEAARGLAALMVRSGGRYRRPRLRFGFRGCDRPAGPRESMKSRPLKKSIDRPTRRLSRAARTRLGPCCAPAKRRPTVRSTPASWPPGP